jgi:ABC-2 type transport system ATP-binding protein
MIRVKGLTKIFDTGNKAIDALDLEVKAGEILALLGPNGAGKTTAIRILSTLSGFDEGKVEVANYDVDTHPEEVRKAIGLVAQQTGVDYFLTGRENLALQGRLYRMKTADIEKRISELAGYFELEDALDRQVTTYSGGMRRKLDIATALIHGPKLLFLDEPTLGLDIKSRQNLWNYIEKLNQEQGLTILLTTHYLEEADHLSHRVAIINQGKIQVVGTAKELKSAILGDAVILTFSSDGPEVGDFTYAMHDDPEVRDVAWQNDKLYLYVENGSEAVPKFVSLASEKGLSIKTLSLAHPTLDDVFLKYTGTTIEDSTEEEGEEWWHQWAGKGGGGGKWQKNWDKWQDKIDETGTEEQKEGWQSQMQQWQQQDEQPPAEQGNSAEDAKTETKPDQQGDWSQQQWPNEQSPDKKWQGQDQGDWKKWQQSGDADSDDSRKK